MKRAMLACALFLSACATTNERATGRETECQQAETTEAIIVACTAAIESGDLSGEALADALDDRGVAYAIERRLSDAAADFEAALRADPDFADAVLHRGMVRAQMGDSDGAIPDLDRALRIDPGNVRALTYRAMAHENGGRYDRAFADIDQAIALTPDDPELHNARCWTGVVSRRDLDRALSDCNESLRLDQENANTLNSRAAVHFVRGEFQAALEDYNASINYDSEGVLAGSYYGRGAALMRLGNTSAGQADITTAVERDPGVAERYTRLGITPE